MKKAIPVTSPLLPPLDEFLPYLETIWSTRRLTNGGPFHQELERALGEYLGVEYLSLFSNGTLALIAALQALGIKGEVITTPYSFVATAHSLVWNGLTPIFVDIDPESFNLNPDHIEAAITPRTTAIMPVHCYGRPCDVEGIQRVADRHGLCVLYDAAHAFGVRDDGGSILRHGDMSVLSLHATKVYNTFEGGAIISPDAKTKQHVDQLKNFGFVDEVTVVASGINGKMSEVNAAFGLLQLKYIDAALQARGEIDCRYRAALEGVPGIRLPAPSTNFSYFPILVEPSFRLSRDALYQRFKDEDIHVRRYFYPLISDMAVYKGRSSTRRHALPVAEAIAGQVLCLPIYPDLQDADLERIIAIIWEG